MGKVAGLAGDEVNVNLPSQNLIYPARVWKLIREFRVGDCVRVRAENKEIIGWVMMVSNSHISVFSKAKWSKVC